MGERAGFTYAIFSDETAAKVTFRDLGNPINDILEFVFPNIEDKNIKRSCKTGCCATYSILKELGLPIKNGYAFSCEFSHYGGKVVGKSAGLAFALAFLQKILDLGFEIAATGEIGTDDRTQVKGVGRIKDKLKASLEVLHKGGIIFYPRANEEEIGEELIERAEIAGVKLIPVRTLREAIEKIIKVPPPKPKWFLLIPILVLCYLAGGFYFQYHCNHHHVRTASVQEYILSAYPWINPYMALEYRPKEKSTVSAIEVPLVKHLKENNWRLGCTISSESEVVEGTNREYTVTLSLDKAYLIRGHNRKPKLLEELDASPGEPGHDLESARINAAEKLWLKIEEHGLPGEV